MKASTGVQGRFIRGQHVRIIGCNDQMTVGSVRSDGWLLMRVIYGPYILNGGWWPTYLVEAA
jgi:hypothetical protein